MGRRKIEIQPIKHERNRTVTLLKRKNGLFKKAYELGVLCSVDVAVIIFEDRPGHNLKLYQYGSKRVSDIVQKHVRFHGETDTRGPGDFSGKSSKNKGDSEGDDEDEMEDEPLDIAPPPSKHNGEDDASLPGGHGGADGSDVSMSDVGYTLPRSSSVSLLHTQQTSIPISGERHSNIRGASSDGENPSKRARLSNSRNAPYGLEGSTSAGASDRARDESAYHSLMALQQELGTYPGSPLNPAAYAQAQIYSTQGNGIYPPHLLRQLPPSYGQPPPPSHHVHPTQLPRAPSSAELLATFLDPNYRPPPAPSPGFGGLDWPVHISSRAAPPPPPTQGISQSGAASDTSWLEFLTGSSPPQAIPIPAEVGSNSNGEVEKKDSPPVPVSSMVRKKRSRKSVTHEHSKVAKDGSTDGVKGGRGGRSAAVLDDPKRPPPSSSPGLGEEHESG